MFIRYIGKKVISAILKLIIILKIGKMSKYGDW